MWAKRRRRDRGPPRARAGGAEDACGAGEGENYDPRRSARCRTRRRRGATTGRAQRWAFRSIGAGSWARARRRGVLRGTSLFAWTRGSSTSSAAAARADARNRPWPAGQRLARPGRPREGLRGLGRRGGGVRGGAGGCARLEALGDARAAHERRVEARFLGCSPAKVCRRGGGAWCCGWGGWGLESVEQLFAWATFGGPADGGRGKPTTRVANFGHKASNTVSRGPQTGYRNTWV